DSGTHAYVDSVTNNNVITSDQGVTNFQSSQGGPPTALPPHADIIIPASLAGQTIEIADSGGLAALTFHSITIASGTTGTFTISPQTSSDSISLDPSYAMS